VADRHIVQVEKVLGIKRNIQSDFRKSFHEQLTERERSKSEPVAVKRFPREEERRNSDVPRPKFERKRTIHFEG